MGPAGERKTKCCQRRQSASPAQKSPATASPERTKSTTSNKQNPPDIVISASPRFTRRKDFKAAGRIRSKDKNNQKKPVAMEDKDMPEEAITQSEANEDIVSIQSSSIMAKEMEEEKVMVSAPEFTVTEVVCETLNEDGICVSSTTHIETTSSDGQTISAVTQESKVSNLDSHAIIGSDEGRSSQLHEVHTKEEREEVVEPAFVVREAYTVGSQEEIARVTSTHQAQECLDVETNDSQNQFEEFQQVETKQNYAELRGERASSCIDAEEQQHSKTSQDALTNIEFVAEKVDAVITNTESYVSQSSAHSTINSSSMINDQISDCQSEYTYSENMEVSSRKPSSLSLEKNGDGTSFWANSARNSVISSPCRDGLADNLGSPTESVRDILIQKRVSLTHTPDIVRVFDKDFQQTSKDIHEFQKVKNELKHVEEQSTSIRKISQVSEYSKSEDVVTQSSESTTSCQVQEEEAEALRALDSVVSEATNRVRDRALSKNMIVDLIPGPVVTVKSKSEKEQAKKEVKKSAQSNNKKITSDEKKTSNKMVEQKNARNTQISQETGTTIGKKTAAKKERSQSNLVASRAQATAVKSQQSVKSLEQINQSVSTTSEADSSASIQRKNTGRQSKSIAKASDDTKVHKSKDKPSIPKSTQKDKKESLQSPNLIKQVKAPTSDKNANKKPVTSTNGSLESPGLLRDINGGSNKSITGRTVSPARKTPSTDSKSSSPVPALARSLSPEGKAPKAGTRSPSASERALSPERKSVHGRSSSAVSGRSSSPPGKGPSRKSSSNNQLDKDEAKKRAGSKSSLNSGNSSSLKRNNSKVREKTIKKEEMLFDRSKNGENKENGLAVKRDAPKTTQSNAKGGFLAPTKSWLLYMGDPIDLKSRSPSPGPPEGKRSLTIPRKSVDRSVSPRRRMRESSTESEGKEKTRKTSACPISRKVTEKDPNLPTVKRSTSVRSKTQTNGDLKRTGSMKKTITNGVDKDQDVTKTSQMNGTDKSEANLTEKGKPSVIKNKQKEASSTSMTRKVGADKTSENKNQININSAEIATKSRSTSGMKKVPPPVAPKPICASNISSEYQVSDSNLVNRSTDSAVSSTAAVTQNQFTSKEIANNHIVQESSAYESKSVTSASQVVNMSETKTLTEQTAEKVDQTSEVNQAEVSVESGIVETSITASEAIQKFETQSKSMMATTEVSISSHLMQDTVSSRMKKVSGEEYIQERKNSQIKLDENSSEETRKTSQDETKKATNATAETDKAVKAVARAKSFSAKKSSTSDSSASSKKTSVLATSAAATTNLSSTSANEVSKSNAVKVSSTALSTSSSSAQKSSNVSSVSCVSTKKSSVSSSVTDSSVQVSKSATKSSTSRSSVIQSSVSASNTTNSSIVEENASQTSMSNSVVEKKLSSAKVSEKMVSQSSSAAVSASTVRSNSLHRSESKGVKQLAVKKSSKSQEINGCSSQDTQLKTTMVVRLHPGQSRRVSAYMDKQDQKGEELSTQTWLGDVQYEDNRASICGLEISFSSVPQDIDIKLIPGNSNCAIDNQASGSEAKVDARPTAPSDSSASSQPLETEPDQNKTRQ